MDVAALPFKAAAFDGVVSLHTIHHLPEDEHINAYRELYRVLATGGKAAVVNGWPDSQLMDAFDPLIRLANRLRHRLNRLTAETSPDAEQDDPNGFHPQIEVSANDNSTKRKGKKGKQPKGTFTSRHDVDWIKNEVGANIPIEIRVWRSVSVRFTRALIHPWLGGRIWLVVIYWLEERFPHYFGERGKYPLIILDKQAGGSE
jgi:SAM-dependent methyltransferase